MIPLGRFGKVEDVAPMAAFLLSDAAAYITGAVIQLDGGLAMSAQLPNPHTNTIDAFWSLLKRGIMGVRHIRITTISA